MRIGTLSWGCSLHLLNYDDEHLQGILAVHARTGRAYGDFNGLDSVSGHGSGDTVV